MKVLLRLLALLTATLSPALARADEKQSLPPTIDPIRAVPASDLPAAPPVVLQEGCACECRQPGKIWFNADYLLWWTKNGSYPTLVTTAPPGTSLGSAGLVGAAGTSVLFPNEDSDNPRSGARLSGGTWLTADQSLGVQGGFFFLATETNDFTTGQNPIVTLPFINAATGAQGRYVVAFPGVATGTAAIDTSSRLFGGDASLLVNLSNRPSWRLDALVGWRFLSLDEDFQLGVNSSNFLPANVTAIDSFNTRNLFNGVDLGLKGEYRQGRWSVGFLAKVALGVTEQTVDIGGVSVINGAAFAGGLYALSSNVGRYNREVFGVIPEANVNVGYQITPRIRAVAGYTFLYANNVARPGAQIDTAVNTNLVPPAVGGGPARPTFNFRDSDYWAQGVNFGLQVRW